MTNLKGIGMTSQRTRDRLVGRLREQGITNLSVLNAINEVPRHIFVDEALAHRAYEDTSLPIGFNQTISQPFIVALMTQSLLKVKPKFVLEVGTGSGYQSAVLSRFCDRLYTVERIPDLVKRARHRLRALSVTNVTIYHSDGCHGLARFAPYDGILVTAAPEEIPKTLLDQLAEGGRMVVPVGGDLSQELKIIDKVDGKFFEQITETVRFVPLLSGKG
jgi:protein-L-isoaspartate(D-aspartate) O-methyltransferase